jgi:hypothetical protein
MLPLRRFLPTDQWVRLLLPAVVVFFAAASDRNYQTDLWHHLARGRSIAASGRLLDEDRFTYTVAGQRLRDVNWGWQVVFFKLFQAGGLALVQTVNAALLAATMLVLTWFSWRQSGSLRSAMLAGLFTFFGLWQLLLIRPQTLSLLLFVVLLVVLEAAKRQRKLLVVPPLIMALWVNVHGGFPIGLVIIGAAVVARVLDAAFSEHADTAGAAGAPRSWPRRLLPCWPWLACLAASGLATLANPYGWGVYKYVLQTAGRASTRHIDEWLPPSMHQLTGFVWVLSLLALLGLFAVSPRRPTRRELCLLGSLLPLAAGSVRMIAWWLLAAAPVLAAQLAARWPALRDDAAQENPTPAAALTCLAFAAVAIVGTPWIERANPALWLPGRAHRTETDLQAIADHLSPACTGRVFTRFAWGEYLGWALADRFTVFADGRIEIFPDAVWAEYSAITRGRSDWDEVLGHYQVTHLVLDAASGYHAELLPQVRRSAQWHEVVQCGDAVLFERNLAY